MDGSKKSMWSEGSIEQYVRSVLKGVRKVIERAEMDYRRLPPWVNAAKIRAIRVNGTIVYSLYPNYTEEDTFAYESEVQNDTALFFGKSRSRRTYIAEPFTDADDVSLPGPVTLTTSVADEDPGSFVVESIGAHIFGGQADAPHESFNVMAAYVQIKPQGRVLATAFVPAAFYIHESNAKEKEAQIQDHASSICKYLSKVHKSATDGQYEEARTQKDQAASLDREVQSISADTAVIVLGAYDKGQCERELREVQDELESQGYDAYLIRDLPGNPSKSVSHKVVRWSMGAKFCVVIDRDASGHLVEYTELTKQEIILALLRAEDSGSTRMIGHEPMTQKLVELFEFSSSPLEVIGDTTEWAENITQEMEEYYSEEYPWR